MMADDYGKLKEEAQQGEEWQLHTLEPAWEAELPEEDFMPLAQCIAASYLLQLLFYLSFIPWHTAH